MKATTIITVLAVLCFSCNKSKEIPKECPYKPIHNFEKKYSELKINRNFSAEFLIGFEAVLKKVTVFKIDPKIKSSVNKMSSVLDSSSLVYDIKFVKKWNILVTDICGKISTLERFNFPSEEREKIEKDMIDKILNFYKILTDTTRVELNPVFGEYFTFFRTSAINRQTTRKRRYSFFYSIRFKKDKRI
jgi:hypothetical protein